uniref:Cyclophilin-like peptidyl-prolyl cis-trans isomerase family protein n=1 Tax=Juniperus procera TaxID=62753 RepID=A0A3Q8BRY6_9CONI|nr:cyclophilin-like peptidyl-prolyl cis-trans isomerase family protein [Juniperus procera]
MATLLSSLVSITCQHPKSHLLIPMIRRRLQTRDKKTITFRTNCNCRSTNSTISQEQKGSKTFSLRFHVPIFSSDIDNLKGVFAIVLIILQTATPFPLNDIGKWFISPANAVLYSPNTKVPRTGEVALRRAIPANPIMKSMQDSLEDIFYLLRFPQRKPYGTMEGDVKNALQIATKEQELIVGSIPLNVKEKGLELYNYLINGEGGLQSLFESIKEKDPDKVSKNLSSSLETIAQLELLQVPDLPYLLPQQYQDFPRLTGRALVEFTVEKADNSMFSMSTTGGNGKTATIKVVLDGYSAPLTAGNFAKLVIDGAYDGVKLKATEQAILSDTEGNGVGFSLPIEIMPAGGFEPFYRTTLNVQDGELPVLPLSVYGAVAMAHNPIAEDYSAPSQFFFYLYEKRNAGLGGLSFDEGQFSVFGYATIGREILPQLKTGDIIKSAKLVEGYDRLHLPASNP